MDRQIAHSERFPQGSLYDDLIAMVFAFHALEAYLNYIGEHLAPEVWANEREFFQKQPYRGFDGRIRKIFELCEIAESDRGTRPYSTVWLLKDLRDFIAHGKTEKISQVVEHGAHEEAPWAKTQLSEYVTKERAYEARDDIAAIAQQIHDAARPRVNDIWFGKGPFDGLLGHNQISSRVAT